jgi:tetratricopeptide (TPR) repeat protein
MAAALVQLAILERKLGRIGPAVAALERALAANPDDLSVVVLLGSYLGEAERPREAARLLAPYADREGPPLDVLTAYGVALARLGRTREATSTFERALKLDPGNPLLLVQAATARLSAGELQAARAGFEAALRLDPELALAHHHLGLLAASRGDWAEAESRYRRALARDPSSADGLLQLGRLLARTERRTEAKELLERFLAVAPPSVYAGEIRSVRAWLTSTRGA